MSDDLFDPEVHATDRKGNPITNKNGSFRKKRADAGFSKNTSPRTSKTTNGSQKKRYVEGVSGIFQIVAAGVSLVDPVDGFCVAQQTPPIADAIGDLAVERPEIAAALDRIMAVGPYGALIGAVLPLAIQIAHNHNKVPEPVARAMGAHPKKDIERHLRLVATQAEQDPGVSDEPLEYGHAA